MTNDEKTIYALGLSISKSIGQFDLSPAELEIVKRALSDSATGKPAENLAEWDRILPNWPETGVHGLPRSSALSRKPI